MKILQRFRISVALSLLILTILPLTTFAATVTFRVADVQAKSEGVIDVPVTAVGAPEMSAVHLELTYDPKVLTAETVTRGSLAGNNSLLDFNAAEPGRVLIGIATLDAIKGDGPLVNVRFKVIGKGGTSTPLTLENSRAWETGAHAEVLVKLESGKATVEGGFPLLLVIIIAVSFAILLMLIIFFLMLRKRKASPQVQRQSAAPPPPSGDPSQPFRQAEDEYYRLKGRMSAGHMSQQQFEAAMSNLTIQDAHGRYWTIDRNTGRWLYYNGQTWIEARPY